MDWLKFLSILPVFLTLTVLSGKLAAVYVLLVCPYPGNKKELGNQSIRFANKNAYKRHTHRNESQDTTDEKRIGCEFGWG